MNSVSGFGSHLSAMDVSMLSDREREIADGVSLGYTNYGIASRLEIAEKTVEKHLTSIFRKLALTSRAQLNRATPRATPPRAQARAPREGAAAPAYRVREAPAAPKSRPT